jgi:segregation and condensation protein B
MAKRKTPENDDQDNGPDEMADEPAAAIPDTDDDWGGISLEELGQAYAEAMAQSGGSLGPRSDDEADSAVTQPNQSSDNADALGESEDEEELWDDATPTPLAIIEAALFIGTPDNRGITETELAALMRDVTPDDVNGYVDRLNETYQANDQALRIHRDEDGFRMGVAPDMEIVRRSFYGKIRETRLSQHAIEVLSLVAYQPGITAEKVQDQRGKESASLLSQLVRRRLLEQRRIVVEGEKKPVATYHPTERFLQIFGLQSLDDLPQVEG